MGKVISLSKEHAPRKALALASDFTFTLDHDRDNGPISDLSKPISVGGIGMGATLIQREVFTKLLSTGKIRRQDSHGQGQTINGPLYGFFDHLYEENALEDIAFCIRWRRFCNGEIFAFMDAEVSHTGSFVYDAKISDRAIK